VPPQAGLALAVFAVALTYASVGHGGASGYLAVMALAGVAPATMSTGALLLNLVVASLSLAAFVRAGQRPGALILPFLAGSVPAALLGSWLAVPTPAYNVLLAVVLLAAAIRMLVLPAALAAETDRVGRIAPTRRGTPPSSPVRVAVGGVIGFVSGIVGVGGGILLSPLLLWRRWAGVRLTAAAAAAFIIVNSLVGILGRYATGRFHPSVSLPVVLAASAGGWLGGWIGAERLPVTSLRRVLGGVLIVAAVAKVVR
jgi:hypothetical protein